MSALGKVSRLKRQLIRLIVELIQFPLLLWFVRSADYIYVLPLNNSWARYFPVFKLFSNAKIITDIYIFASDYARDRMEQLKLSQSNLRNARKLDRAIIKWSDYLIHTSERELKFVAKREGIMLAAEKVIVIPQFAPTRELISFFPDRTNESVFSVCWWGMPSPLHGLNDILEAVLLYRSKMHHNDRDICLTLFCGRKPEEMILELESNIKSLHLNDFVVINKEASFGNGQLIEQLRAGCDLALGHFSNHSEKSRIILTTKVIDAISLGIPVLTRKTLVQEEFLDGKTDIYVCEPNAESIAATMLDISRNPDESQCRKLKALEKFHQHFSNKAFNRKLKSFLISLK